MKTVLIYARALRVNQWTKNFVIYAAILFAGKIFDWNLLGQSSYAFLVFCLLSSTSYILNDIIDYQYDKKHPMKKYRPLAAGLISIPQATFMVFVLTIVSLLLALLYSLNFFFLCMLFLLLHFFYSLYLKKFPVIDIFTISLSFVLRTWAGMVVTGYHVPIWLILTIFFISLFMATVKRHAELVTQGKETRESLFRYKHHLLYFLSTTFATLTIVSYALYTYTLYIDPSQQTIFTDKTICQQLFVKAKDIRECEKQVVVKFLPTVFPTLEVRKLMMLTVPFVVYGIARYAQLLYEREEGERPEKIITTDKPLMITIGLWALMIVLLIYIL
ncbi:UbiA prenyltransferase family protein [Candidatus Woesebacteria bacterium]|nr:UbiA prenyltransferase family protein [Candidatus Woesebacteria bacterium]